MTVVFYDTATGLIYEKLTNSSDLIADDGRPYVEVSPLFDMFDGNPRVDLSTMTIVKG